MPKWRQKIDASWMGILSDFFRFWEPTWLQNGGKLGIENALLLSLTEKGENPKSTYFSNRILIFFGFGWSKIGAKIDQKSMKQRPQHGKASWHRFFTDFCGFWWFLRGKLGRKIEPRSMKKSNEKRWKNERHQVAKKVATRENLTATRENLIPATPNAPGPRVRRGEGREG